MQLRYKAAGFRRSHSLSMMKSSLFVMSAAWHKAIQTSDLIVCVHDVVNLRLPEMEQTCLLSRLRKAWFNLRYAYAEAIPNVWLRDTAKHPVRLKLVS